MSCEIKNIGKLNFSKVQSLFGLSTEEKWLNSVYYSVSPTMESAVFAHGSKLVYLESKFSYEKQENLFDICWSTEVENQNDLITAVLCVPIVGNSSQPTSDWTCIVVGFSSGLVQFYTDSRYLLASHSWHNEPVVNLKAQSGKHVNEELHVYHSNCVCVIEGYNIFSALKSIRLQYIKSATVHSSPKEGGNILDITCRKWGFNAKDGHSVEDAIVVGLQNISTFDHLLTASLEGGFYAKYRSAAPQSTLVVAAGIKPYVGFHYAKEGFNQPVLQDIARVATSLIKSALPSWFSKTSKSTAPEPQVPMAPIEPMICRFGLCDLTREGLNIWLSPKGKLCAVSDNLGRIVLVDVEKTIAVRVWKGYRDAQCCFVEISEKLQKNMAKTERKSAQFLVIYAPRRQVIEVWSLQRGPRVATFSAPRNGVLLHFNYGLMGVATSSKVKNNTSLCIFMDPSDNSLKDISIPFHCANINDADSKTAKDMHLYKRLKLCLRNFESREQEEQIMLEISNILNAIETNEMQHQALEVVTNSKKITPKVYKAALESLLLNLQESNASQDCERMDDSDLLQEYHDNSEINMNEAIKTQCENMLRVVDFYMKVKGMIQADKSAEDGRVFTVPLNENLRVGDTELDTIQKLIDLATLDKNASPSSSNGLKVTFGEKTKEHNAFHEYLSVFYGLQPEQVLLKTDKINIYGAVGSTIFATFLEDGKSTLNLSDWMLASGVASEDFLKLFLHYWAEKPFNYTSSEELINDMTRFYDILKHICAYAGKCVTYEYNSICSWWQNVREYLLDSSCALRGLLAALICRNQALKYQGKSLEDGEAMEVDESNFEEVSQEACQWTLLITRLDDIAVLGAILGNQVRSKDICLPPMKYDPPEISLKSILDGGRGIITELVSKWITASGIDPQKLVEPNNAESTSPTKIMQSISSNEGNLASVYSNQQLTPNDLNLNDLESTEKTKHNRNHLEPVLYCLEILRDHFPFSLESKSILCQMSWDYLSHWSRNLTELHFMRAGLDCLRVFRECDYPIKHGICIMIWNAHLKITLKATKQLIDKTGRLPKEKLCIQDIGIPDTLTAAFLEFCREFMHHLISSVSDTNISLKFEEILLDNPSKYPLTVLALEQSKGNVELLKLHDELLRVLHLIASLNIKYSKPVQTLFNGMANMSFFTDIKKPLPYTIPEADLILKNNRNNFLCKVITATMDLIREDQKDIYILDHQKFMMLVFELVEIWQLNLVDFQQHQIVELYAHGWDSYAETLFEHYLDIQNIGPLLLKIAGRRLNLFTRNDPTATQLIAGAGPALFNYLDTLEESESSNLMKMQTSNTIEKIMKLSEKAFHFLASSNAKELRVAGLLLDAVATIKERS